MMKCRIKSIFAVLAMALIACSDAYAAPIHKGPEIDPSLAVAGLTLLAGTIAVLRTRRKK
jgi:LPXTG-motif cell wall-anchored protein